MVKKAKLPLGLIVIIGLTFLIGLAFLMLLWIPIPLLNALGIVAFIGFVILGIGLIKLKRKARDILFALFILIIVADIIGLPLRITKFDIQFIVRTAIEIIVLFYLNKPKIKELFH